jgi:hypothetical protein
MNRRNFFKWLGVGAAAPVAAAGVEKFKTFEVKTSPLLVEKPEGYFRSCDIPADTINRMVTHSGIPNGQLISMTIGEWKTCYPYSSSVHALTIL